MAADGDDEIGAAVQGQQHGRVHAAAVERQAMMLHLVHGQPGHATRFVVAVTVGDDDRRRLERAIGDVGELADDQIGPDALIEEDVRSGVDADHVRPLLLDVPTATEHGEIVLIIQPGRNDQDLPTPQRQHEIGKLRQLREADVLVAQVFERTGREEPDLVVQPALRHLHSRPDRDRRLAPAGGDALVAQEDVVADDGDLEAVVEPGEDLVADTVDQRNPALDQGQRPVVREPAGDGVGRIDDGGHPLSGQRLCRLPVDVGMVDQGDLAAVEPADQRRRVVPGPDSTGDHLGGNARRPAAQTGVGGTHTRALPPVPSSSAACCRADSLSGEPDNMRESSVTRSSSTTASIDVFTEPAFPSFSTTR